MTEHDPLPGNSAPEDPVAGAGGEQTDRDPEPSPGQAADDAGAGEDALGAERGAGGEREASDAPESPGTPEFERRDQTVREQRRLGNQSLSDWARGIGTAHGPVGMGDGSVTIGVVHAATINFGGAGHAPLHKGPLDQAWLDRRRRSFVEGSAYQELVRRLPEGPVQVLRGADGSGRATTAVLALERVAASLLAGGEAGSGDGDRGARERPASGGRPSVVEVLDRDSEPGAITGRDLRKGHGYLLDRSGAGREAIGLGMLTELLALARDRGAFLVLIVDDRVPVDDHDLRDFLVQQARPDPQRVLDAHLHHLLGGREPNWTEELRTEVKEQLEAAPAPRQVVDLAVYLARATQQDLGADEVIAGFHAQLLAKAREKLFRPFEGEEPPRNRAEWLCRQAQLIACAVLSDMPLVTVTEAAVILAGRLHEVQTGGRPLSRRVFGATIGDLLRYAEATDRSDDGTSTSEPVTRRVRMRPGLPAAVLRVTWDDYDTIREPLLAWLQELAVRGGDAVQVRAAVAVGKLACYDFDYVCCRVIDPWAGSRRPADRRAAAWALETAADDDRLEPLVRERVRRWCHESPYHHQRTALLALGTGIGVRDVDSTLKSLGLLAPRPAHGHDYALALALREVFLAGYQEQTRASLVGWAEEGEAKRLRPLLVQAARGLLALSEEAPERAEGHGPDLLDLFVREQAWRETATRLWGLALTEATTSEAGWNLLRSWLRRAARDPALVEPLVELLTELVQDPRLRSRAQFRKRLWTADQVGRHHVVERMLARALAWRGASPNPERSAS